MSKGGSRFGAGRIAYRVKADQVQRVDVRQWTKRGHLSGQGWFSWSWHIGGEPAGSIGVRVESRFALALEYTVTTDGAARSVSQRIEVPATPCTYGGSRQWFACPCCGRRVAVLYLRWTRFACRHCQRVAYASQSEDELDRMWRKQSKLEARLGANWRRPKGMRQRTYARLFAGVVECEERRDGALEAVMLRLFG